MKLIIANKNYSSWSLRPWVLMKTLGIPFEEMVLPFHQKSLFQIHTPQGKVPVLVDSARQNLVVWDSLAIVEYLAEQYSAVWATEVQVRSWSRSACAQMHSGFGNFQ
jgi:glutathione S-transferase